jgi:uncharacterized cupin superfamily protein
MNEVIIKNAKTSEFTSINLNQRFDPQTTHKKHFEFANLSVSSPQTTGGKLHVAFYTLMPGKSNFPYHYHTGMEEVYYIINGTGVLRTPEGEKTVTEGDVIVFPANENGAHQLTNNSNEPLVYLDVDTYSSPEVVFYPDKGDFRVMAGGVRKNFSLDNEVNYLRDE